MGVTVGSPTGFSGNDRTSIPRKRARSGGDGTPAAYGPAPYRSKLPAAVCRPPAAGAARITTGVPVSTTISDPASGVAPGAAASASSAPPPATPLPSGARASAMGNESTVQQSSSQPPSVTAHSAAATSRIAKDTDRPMDVGDRLLAVVVVLLFQLLLHLLEERVEAV